MHTSLLWYGLYFVGPGHRQVVDVTLINTPHGRSAAAPLEEENVTEWCRPGYLEAGARTVRGSSSTCIRAQEYTPVEQRRNEVAMDWGY